MNVSAGRAGVGFGFGFDPKSSGTLSAAASAALTLALALVLACCCAAACVAAAPDFAFAANSGSDGTRSEGVVEVIPSEDGADDTDASATNADSTSTQTAPTTPTTSTEPEKVVTIVESAEIAASATLGLSSITIPIDDPANTIDVGQLADSSFLYDAKIGDLALADSYYDDQTVKVRGEVVGDAIRPMLEGRDACWITLRDFDTGDTISVFVRASDLDKIDVYGAYGRVGTTLEIQGTYHLDCADHEGDSDIHATVVDWVAAGYEIPDQFDIRDFEVPFGLLLGGLALGAVYWFLRERSR